MSGSVQSTGDAGTAAAGPGARRTTRAAMWATLDTVSQTFVSTLAFLIVARLLGPKDFGVAAISFGIYQIANLFVETLLQDAVVQTASLSRRQINSAFWWNLSSGAVGMIVLMVTSPLFADLLAAPAITGLLRVMSLGLICTGAGAVPIALLRRSLSFRHLAMCSVIARIATAAASAGLALAGAGAFALVAQTTIGPLLLTTLVIIVSRFRPGLEFSWREVRALLAFGLHVVAGQLVSFGSTRLYIICIGVLFGPTTVGFYNIAQRVVDTARDTIGSAVSSLAVPVLSRHQHNHTEFRTAVGQGTELLCLLVVPVFALLGGCAVPLVHLLLGDKWTDAVPIIQVFAASAVLYFFRFLQFPAITAAGRPDLWFLVSLFGSAAMFAILFAFARHSFAAATFTWAFGRTVVTFPVAAYVLWRTIGLRVQSQLMTGLGPALAAVLGGLTAYLVCRLVTAATDQSALHDMLSIILGGLSGVAVTLLLVAVIARSILISAYRIIGGALKRSG